MDRGSGMGSEKRHADLCSLGRLRYTRRVMVRRGKVRPGNVRSPGWALVSVFLLLLTLSGCTAQPNAPVPPDPAALLQAIPSADAAQYERVTDMRQWRNPYIMVRTNDVVLYDVADNAEIQLKPEELLPALAKLPASNWPYGRVVAAAENGARASDQDGVAIRRIKGIVGGLLANAKIAVKWVPSP